MQMVYTFHSSNKLLLTVYSWSVKSVETGSKVLLNNIIYSELLKGGR